MEDINQEIQEGNTSFTQAKDFEEISVALLTGGGDKPYALGLSRELIRQGVPLEIIGSNDLDCPDFHGNPRVRFLNLRGDQRSDIGFAAKTFRIVVYYLKLILYASSANPGIFHILWNNKFQHFDRTLLMLYYRALRKRIAVTVHNVNMGVRDSQDTRFNRLTLRIQYLLANHLFVHTEKMKRELIDGFGVRGERVTVIPFGINNAVPITALTPKEARRRLGIGENERTILFFGNIARYKGLECLVDAFKRMLRKNDRYRLVIAGRPKGSEDYWNEIREMISSVSRISFWFASCRYQRWISQGRHTGRRDGFSV
jgi:glycosyltransferase involved in cell wall biosynthesis